MQEELEFSKATTEMYRANDSRVRAEFGIGPRNANAEIVMVRQRQMQKDQERMSKAEATPPTDEADSEGLTLTDPQKQILLKKKKWTPSLCGVPPVAREKENLRNLVGVLVHPRFKGDTAYVLRGTRDIFKGY